MDSFWDNLIEHFKSRNASFFVPALMIFFAVIIVGGLIYDKVPPESFFCGLAGIGIVASVLVWRAIRNLRARSGKKSRHQELSRDEIRKARSKLVDKIKI